MKKNESFERMIEGTGLLLEEMGLKAHEYKSHASRVLKIEADPETPEHVWVYIPEAIYVGCENVTECAEWTAEYWAQVMGKLAKLFMVKGHATARMMIPRSPKESRMYANYFWAREINVRDSMKSWNIQLQSEESKEQDEETAEPSELEVNAEIEALGMAIISEIADLSESDDTATSEDDAQREAQKLLRINDMKEYQRKNRYMFM